MLHVPLNGNTNLFFLKRIAAGLIERSRRLDKAHRRFVTRQDVRDFVEEWSTDLNAVGAAGHIKLGDPERTRNAHVPRGRAPVDQRDLDAFSTYVLASFKVPDRNVHPLNQRQQRDNMRRGSRPLAPPLWRWRRRRRRRPRYWFQEAQKAH